MKTALLGLAALAAMALVPAAPAAAASARAQDFSSARQHHVHHYAARHYAHPRVYAAPDVYDPAGINAGTRPDSLLSFYRRNNICAIDEGYGRVTRCN